MEEDGRHPRVHSADASRRIPRDIKEIIGVGILHRTTAARGLYVYEAHEIFDAIETSSGRCWLRSTCEIGSGLVWRRRSNPDPSKAPTGMSACSRCLPQRREVGIDLAHDAAGVVQRPDHHGGSPTTRSIAT